MEKSSEAKKISGDSVAELHGNKPEVAAQLEEAKLNEKK